MLFSRKKFRATLGAALFAVPLATALSTPAKADTITRGCFGVILLLGEGLPVRSLVDMDARGACEGRRNANTCRVRAHDVLRSCIDAVRTEWADHDIPNACLPTSAEGRSGMNFFTFQGIFPNLPHGPNSIEDRIRYESCCSGGGRLGDRVVSVNWAIGGDRGCFGSTSRPAPDEALGGTIWRDIITPCTEIWDAGYCTGPRPQGTRTNPTE